MKRIKNSDIVNVVCWVFGGMFIGFCVLMAFGLILFAFGVQSLGLDGEWKEKNRDITWKIDTEEQTFVETYHKIGETGRLYYTERDGDWFNVTIMNGKYISTEQWYKLELSRDGNNLDVYFLPSSFNRITAAQAYDNGESLHWEFERVNEF